jgi:aminoglycoside phosphotransferase (APT) family kinase protein
MLVDVPGEPDALPDDLIGWIESIAGGRVTRVDRQPGGARKEAWFVDLERASGEVDELFLRYDRSDPAKTGDPWTLHREAAVYLALQGSEVPVPRVIGVHEIHQAMLCARVTGQNWFSRITDPAEQVATAKDFMTKLAALHRTDPAALDLPGFPPPTTIPELVRHELDEWERVIGFRGGRPDPALGFTLGWLRRNVPDVEGPVVLVQGDTGPGNFMYARGRVVAVVDWELAHLGDPMDDIAWLSLRATQEPFTDFPARLREYEQLSGHAIDEARVRYYQVMAEAKLQVMQHGAAAPGTSGSSAEGVDRDIGNALIYGVLHRRLWLEALAACIGLDLEPVTQPPPHERRDHDRLYDVLLRQLRDVVVPRITNPLALQRSKGLARIIKYLAAISEHGAFYDECELDDAAELLGGRPLSLAAGRAAVADEALSGGLTDLDYLRYLWRRVSRDNELLRASSGALADRHWPPLH